MDTFLLLCFGEVYVFSEEIVLVVLNEVCGIF